MAAQTTVRNAIETGYTELSEQQRRAADYLLAHETTAFALSVQELAAAAEVSEATLVRFARRVGYGGYHELRTALMREAQRDRQPGDRFAAEPASDAPADTLARVAANELANIQRTASDLDRRALRQAVKALDRAERVACVGVGASAVVAQAAAYQLFQIGVQAHAVARDVLSIAEQVEHLPRKTALLVASMSPYSKVTVAAAERARARRLAVVAVTDSYDAPIRSHASASLIVASDNILFTHSLSGALLAVSALVTELALSNKPRALRQLEVTDRAARGDYL